MRRMITLLLVLLMLAALAVPAAAANNTDVVLILKDGNVRLSGAVFEIYRIGEEKDGALVLTGAFAGYPIDPNTAGEDSSAEATALYSFAKKDGLTPDVIVQSNAQGTAAAEALAPGLYLLGGRPLTHGEYVYHTEPQLLLLPQKHPTTGELQDSLLLRVKFSREPHTGQGISRRVLKIWNDHSGNIRPESVTVHLLKNGSVHSTVTLTAQNQWRHTWENLDASALWQITEDVPEGYTVAVEQEEDTFLLTNSAPEVPAPETSAPSQTVPPYYGDRIPQTGTLWWPVCLVAALGLLVTAAGFFFKKKGLKLLGILLLLISILMIANGFRKKQVAEKTSREVMTQLQLPARAQQPESEGTPVRMDIPDWQRNPHIEMPETIIDGTAYIGTLEIPQLQLQLPLVSETTGPNLQKAPCRYSGSPYTGDLVLGAHNYDAHFGRLKKLSYGEELQVTDLDGNVFRYQVADIEILQPEQLEDLLAGGWPLTLYTCTPGGQSRVVVRCDTA